MIYYPRGARREFIAFVEDRPGHDRRYAIDPSKIEADLGWSAQETFESGPFEDDRLGSPQ